MYILSHEYLLDGVTFTHDSAHRHISDQDQCSPKAWKTSMKMVPVLLEALLIVTQLMTWTVADEILNIPIDQRFDDLIRANKQSFVVHMSTIDVTQDNIRDIDNTGREIRHLWDVVLTPVGTYTFTAVHRHNNTQWRNYPQLFQLKREQITIMLIYCPGTTSWETFIQSFPIQHLPNLRMLRIQCPIPKIDDKFFQGYPNLFYLDLRINIKTSLHQNSLMMVSKLTFLKLITYHYQPSPSVTYDLLCPVSGSLKYINMSLNNNASLFSITQCKNSNFDQLAAISITENNLHTLHKNSFKLFKNTKVVFINSNGLTFLSPRAFVDLNQLYSLSISNGDIQNQNIPDITYKLTFLSGLYLTNNSITHLEGRFGKNLLRLNLDQNNISDINADTFSSCVNLRFLNLQGNKIKVIKSRVFHSLTILYSLDLSKNVINKLEKGCFGNLQNVRVLTLSHNLITHLTPDIFETFTDNMTKAEDMTNTKSHLNLLVNLDVSHNQITHIDLNTFHFSKLTGLLLNNNKLSHLSGELFTNIPQLKYLYLSHNYIQVIPHRLFHNLPSLEVLYLSSNNLSTLPCDMLRPYTRMVYNRALVSDTPCPSNLTILDLHDNHLHDNALCFLSRNACPVSLRYPRQPTFLQNLRTLFVYENLLTFINGSHLSDLPSLKSFFFIKNPLECSCNLVPFAEWVRSHESIVGTGLFVTCKNGSSDVNKLVDIPDDLDCTVTVNHTISVNHTVVVNHTEVVNHTRVVDHTTVEQNLRVIVSLCVIVVAGIIVAIFCGYYRMEIAILLYAKTGLRLRRYNPEFVDKRYNVMVWCHDRDNAYANRIIQVLEPYFTVYWNQRDCMPGEIMERGFEQGITSSERVIVILTRNFVTDPLTQLKFENFHISLGNKVFGAILIIADDEIIEHKQRLYERIRAYVRTRQYLRDNDRLFWKKLFFRLPPPRDDAEAVVYGDLENPRIDFNGQQPLGDMLAPIIDQNDNETSDSAV